MIFNLFTGNHDNPSIEDYVLLLRLMLEEGGHRVYRESWLSKDATTVIIENFTAKHDSLLQLIRAKGVPYIIVATEMITGDTFNDFPFAASLPHYSNKAMWKERHDACMEWCRTAKAVWLATSDPAQIGIYRERTGTKVVELKPSFHKNYVPIERRPEGGLFFSGSMTPHRKAILDKFPNLTYMPAHTLPIDRDLYLARASACLDLRLCPEYGQLSQLRVWYQLMNRCPTIVERPSMPARLEPYTLSVPTSGLTAACQYTLADGNHETFFAGLIQKFRDETNGAEESARVIGETF